MCEQIMAKTQHWRHNEDVVNKNTFQFFIAY